MEFFTTCQNIIRIQSYAPHKGYPVSALVYTDIYKKLDISMKAPVSKHARPSQWTIVPREIVDISCASRKSCFFLKTFASSWHRLLRIMKRGHDRVKYTLVFPTTQVALYPKKKNDRIVLNRE